MKRIDIKLKKHRIFNKQILIYFFLCIPFLDINSLWFYIGNKVHYGIALISLAILNLILLSKYRSIYVDKFIFCFAMYEAVSISSAFLHGTLSAGILYSIVVLWTIIQLLHFKFSKTLKALVVIFSIIMVIDFIGIWCFDEARIINADTLLQNRFSTFTGGRNTLAPTLVPMAFIVVFYYFLKNERRTFYTTLTIFLCLATVVLGKSATGIIVAAFGAMLYFVLPALKIDTKFYLWGYLAAFLLLVVFTNVLVSNAGIQWILMKLGRSTDLSLRPVVWNNAFAEASTHFLLGGGRGSRFSVIVSEVLRYDNFSETHNMFIQLLVDDGVLGLFFYCIMIVQAMKRLRTKENVAERLLVIGIICFMINGLTESLQSKILFFILLGITNEYSGRKYGERKYGERKERKQENCYSAYCNI